MCNTQEYYEQLTGWNQDRADQQLYNVYRAIYDSEVYALVAWNGARLDCAKNAQAEAYDNQETYNENLEVVGMCFLGSVFSVMPSGKF